MKNKNIFTQFKRCILLTLLFVGYMGFAHSPASETVTVTIDDFPIDPCAVLSADLQPYNGQTNTTQIFANNVIGIGDARMTVTHPYGSERLAQDRISDTHEAGAAGLNLGHATGTNVANTFDLRIETEVSFSAPVKDLSFRINDLDNGDRVRVLAYDENDVLIPFGAANYAFHPVTLVTYHSGIGVTGEFQSTNTEVGDTRGTIDFNFNGRQVSRVVFQYYDVTDGGTYSIAKFSGIDSTNCPDCTNSGETSVNLNSMYTGTFPTGVELQWWTSPTRDLDPTPGTLVTDPENVTASGTYYAFFYDTVNLCYNTDNSTAFVNVTILPPCDTTCTQPGDFSDAGQPTKVGITVQQKQDNWPESIPNGFIALESKEKGLVITRVAHVGGTTGTPDFDDAIADPKEGMLVYDIEDKCVKLFNGEKWKCIEKSCNTAEFTLNCSDLVISGDTHGPAVNFTITLPYSNGDGTTYAQQIMNSIDSLGLSGLTASLSAGTLANGSGEFIITVSGTVDNGGAAYFQFEINGHSCLIVSYITMDAGEV